MTPPPTPSGAGPETLVDWLVGLFETMAKAEMPDHVRRVTHRMAAREILVAVRQRMLDEETITKAMSRYMARHVAENLPPVCGAHRDPMRAALAAAVDAMGKA